MYVDINAEDIALQGPASGGRRGGPHQNQHRQRSECADDKKSSTHRLRGGRGTPGHPDDDAPDHNPGLALLDDDVPHDLGAVHDPLGAGNLHVDRRSRHRVGHRVGDRDAAQRGAELQWLGQPPLDLPVGVAHGRRDELGVHAALRALHVGLGPDELLARLEGESGRGNHLLAGRVLAAVDHDPVLAERDAADRDGHARAAGRLDDAAGHEHRSARLGGLVGVRCAAGVDDAVVGRERGRRDGHGRTGHGSRDQNPADVAGHSDHLMQ